jgi:hypothetical protein
MVWEVVTCREKWTSGAIARQGSTPREVVETSLKQVSAKKRVVGIVFHFVNQDRAQKYGGEYYYGKTYEKYYSA